MVSKHKKKGIKLPYNCRSLYHNLPLILQNFLKTFTVVFGLFLLCIPLFSGEIIISIGKTYILGKDPLFMMQKEEKIWVLKFTPSPPFFVFYIVDSFYIVDPFFVFYVVDSSS